MARAEAIIDLAAIDSNVRHLLKNRNAIGLAVVKADAYGHGLIPVARCALKAGAKWLGTALLEEAVALRDAGITAPTIAWLTPPSDDFELALRSQIDIAIPSLDHLAAVIAAAERSGVRPRLHLEVDTGMSRGGALGEWRPLCERAAELASAGKIEVIGIWSHLARADEPEHEFNSIQLQQFEKSVAIAREVGLNPQLIHFSNSAAALTKPSFNFDMIRLGISMYGLSPEPERVGGSAALGLKPALALRARLHLVKEVPGDSQVGYGGTARTERPTKLGVVAIGYADGIPRNASNLAGVLVGNKCAPIIGRVSMDQFVVDLGNDSVARAGEWVYLIGPNGSDGYTADSWARACGTINYEIVTRIGPRVPRTYLD